MSSSNAKDFLNTDIGKIIKSDAIKRKADHFNEKARRNREDVKRERRTDYSRVKEEKDDDSDLEQELEDERRREEEYVDRAAARREAEKLKKEDEKEEKKGLDLSLVGRLRQELDQKRRNDELLAQMKATDTTSKIAAKSALAIATNRVLFDEINSQAVSFPNLLQQIDRRLVRGEPLLRIGFSSDANVRTLSFQKQKMIFEFPIFAKKEKMEWKKLTPVILHHGSAHLGDDFEFPPPPLISDSLLLDVKSLCDWYGEQKQLPKKERQKRPDNILPSWTLLLKKKNEILLKQKLAQALLIKKNAAKLNYQVDAQKLLSFKNTSKDNNDEEDDDKIFDDAEDYEMRDAEIETGQNGIKKTILNGVEIVAHQKLDKKNIFIEDSESESEREDERETSHQEQQNDDNESYEEED